MNKKFIFMSLILVLVVILSICLGSVYVSPKQLLKIFSFGGADDSAAVIILRVRLPRVLCAVLIGAALSISGAAAQGLLKNPLVDGSTLGVSSGASLGAVAAIAFGLKFFAFAPITPFAVLAAFLSLLIVLRLSRALDANLSTNTVILTGVVFTMFTNAAISFIIAMAGEKVKTITFWTMGSLARVGYKEAGLLLVVFVFFSIFLFLRTRELNAFAFGEKSAANIGVNVKRVKLEILFAMSVLTGVCVAVGGAIGFVGLIAPHISRAVVGANHRRLLPFSAIFGGAFLTLADLLSRTILSPKELPIGVLTSFSGACVFVVVFYRTRKGKN